jgi:two-component system chemotaxis sensor kinase CheA
MFESNDFIDTFRQEAEELLLTVEESILDLEEDSEDKDAINALFRAIHTLKGSGSMLGFTELAGLAHHVESVLDRVRSDELAIDRELIDLVLIARDLIKGMLLNDPSSPCDDPASLEKTVQVLKALLGTQSESSDRKLTMDKRPRGARQVRIHFKPCRDSFLSGMDPAFVLQELQDLGECQLKCLAADVPSLDELDPLECHLAWDIVLRSAVDPETIRGVFLFVEDGSTIRIDEPTADSGATDDHRVPMIGEILVQQGALDSNALDQVLQERKKLGEQLVEAGLVSKEAVDGALEEQAKLAKKRAAADNDSVRVPSSKLDKLINLIGELVITQAQLSQVADGIQNYDLSTATEEVERLVSELRDLVLSVRMMPIGITFNRFRRLVRDLSAELGKDMELVTEGGETELDKGVIDRLADPLVHLIRNCVDHGIESPSDRIASGKQTKGRIRLVAAHRGTNVAITVQDDGKGLDADAIRRKAIEKGLIGADAQLSTKDTFALVMRPGFSTAQQVTSLSGRGVGMDVVKREIDSLRGTIEIDTEAKKGTSIVLSLPLTLAIIEGLLVQIGASRFVIPLSVVEECLELTPDNFVLGRHRDVVQVRGEPLPCVSLRGFFHLREERSGLEECVVVRIGSNRFVIVVDHVVGDHQTVIKSLGRAYKDVIGVSGATILGDGTVALILDVDSIVREAEREEARALGRAA